MHRTLRAVVSLVVGLAAGFTLGFLLVPDPTGAGPLLAGPVVGLPIGAAIFLKTGGETDPATG